MQHIFCDQRLGAAHWARCNALQHIALQLKDTATQLLEARERRSAAYCNTLQYTATHCNTTTTQLQRCTTTSGSWAATWRGAFSALQHTATRCNTLQHTATQLLGAGQRRGTAHRARCIDAL